MSSKNADLKPVVDRVMRAWSLIKLIPDSRLSEERLSVLALLEDHAQLQEKELLILGLKYLHEADRQLLTKQSIDAK
jgi:hypothetical protein